MEDFKNGILYVVIIDIQLMSAVAPTAIKDHNNDLDVMIYLEDKAQYCYTQRNRQGSAPQDRRQV